MQLMNENNTWDMYGRGFSGATVQISDQLKHYSLINNIANVKCAHLGEVTLFTTMSFDNEFGRIDTVQPQNI